MRKNVGHESRVRWLVEFMIGLYEQGDIIDPVRTIVDEACSSDPDVRRDHYFVYGSLVNRLDHDERAKKILAATNPQFFQLEDAPEFIKELPRKFAEANSREKADLLALIDKAVKRSEANQAAEAGAILRQVLELDSKNGWAPCFLAMVTADPGRHDETEKLVATLESLAP